MKLRIAVVLCIIGIFVWFGHVRPGTIVIQEGDSVSSVATSLRAAGIIRSESLFKIAFRIFKTSEHVYPGVVQVGASCGMRCVVHEVGSSVRPVARITFVEGHDIHDLGALLESKGLGSSSALIAVVGAPATAPTSREDLTKDFSFLVGIPKNISYEGYLFPDTYDFNHDVTVDQVVRTMLKNFDRRVTPDMRAAATAGGRTLHEVITLASILEKEVRTTEDRQMVADLLWRRLDRGMGLQVDSSVNYATESDGVYTTHKDRASNSLWNTYKYKGLPIGPIGNPGLDAIQAALHPKHNDYWFFLVSPDGTVHYARSLDEQIANKKYLK